LSTVLIIGDCHCPAMRRGYVRFLQGVADHYGPDRIVHIGDLVDWHSISYHESSPELHSPIEEMRKAKRQVRSLVEAFPEADWLIGNHDSLTERQATSARLPSDVLKPYGELW
jgi:metallophosphoesterase superfamily enzyme